MISIPNLGWSQLSQYQTTQKSLYRKKTIHPLFYVKSIVAVVVSKKVATIDNADYSVGDTVPTMGMEIIAIGTARVEFVKQAITGEECHILKFRQKKTDTNQRGLR